MRKQFDRDEVQQLLQRYARGLSCDEKGWKICCPFHDDSKPSAIVFYDTGIFSCFSGCGAHSPTQGLQKLGVANSDIQRIFGKNRSFIAKNDLKALDDDLELDLHLKKEHKTRVTCGILEREAWPNWNFRGVRAELLTSPRSKLVKLFKPELIRLWLNVKGKYRRERFPRLSLSLNEQHRVYLRLSTKQKIKVRNSDGLELKDMSLPPIGLSSYVLPTCRGVILVEGPYDLLKTYQNLYDLGLDRDFTVLSLLGIGQWKAFRTKFEMRLLPQMSGKNLILFLDNDKPGRDLTKIVIHENRSSIWLPEKSVKVLPYCSHDPGDTDPEEFKQGLRQLQLI